MSLRGSFGACIVAIALVGCGARTGLGIDEVGDAGPRPDLGDAGHTADAGRVRDLGPDADAGPECTEARPCSDACGDGVQPCIDGAWGGCEVPETMRDCSTVCGPGTQSCIDGIWGSCSAEIPRPPTLTVRIRDFHDTHPDFESAIGDDRGIVEPFLGADGLPVYAGPTPTTHGRVAFDQWYRDTPGVNLGTDLVLPLAPAATDPRLYVYDDDTFFPIDGMLFGNEGRPHDFHFTVEATSEFEYRGGEIFRFRGDDDVFVFIAGTLVIDLGGVHSTEEATVALDALGLTVGSRYTVRLFFAERHTTASTFTVETTIADVLRCD